MKDIIPSVFALLLSWLTNFKTQLTNYASTLNLSTQQVTDMSVSCDKITAAINDTIQKKHDYEVSKALRDSIIADETQKLRVTCNLIKLNPAYNDGIGQAFDILYAAAPPVDTQNFKSVITLSLGHGFVSVKFTKKGIEGVNVYCRLKGESNWTFLTLAMHSPYNDHRMLADPIKPENREYMVIGVFADVEIGLPSDIASITFAG
ncbi:MAG: hypothetical protein WCO54_07780 [Bacteroidota bacterium]